MSDSSLNDLNILHKPWFSKPKLTDKEKETLKFLQEAVKSIGFKKIDFKLYKLFPKLIAVTYSIDCSLADEEKAYMGFKSRLFPKSSQKFLSVRSYFSVNNHKYKFSKLYQKYILRLLNLINKEILIAAFFFDFTNNTVYYEIDLVFPTDLNDVRLICGRATDETVIAMSSYTKAIHSMLIYLKSIKSFLLNQHEKKKTLPPNLFEEIETNTKKCVTKAKLWYDWMRKKDLSFARSRMVAKKNEDKEGKIRKLFLNHIDLNHFLMLNKYEVSDKVRVPVYSTKIGEVISTKYALLEETLKIVPQLVFRLEYLLNLLLDAGYVVSDARPFLQNFITSSDLFIHLRIQHDFLLCDTLDCITDEKKHEYREWLRKEFIRIIEGLVERQPFDFSVMEVNIDELIKEVE